MNFTLVLTFLSLFNLLNPVWAFIEGSNVASCSCHFAYPHIHGSERTDAFRLPPPRAPTPRRCASFLLSTAYSPCCCAFPFMAPYAAGAS